MHRPIARIRVHPGIGIARLGNSDEYFIGPEAPGQVVDPGGSGGPGPQGGTYRDSRMRLKRQAQRFRIYGYDAAGKVVAEVNSTLDQVRGIEWRVHVRNMKAANYAFQGPYLFDPTKYRNPCIQGDASSAIERSNLIIDPGPVTINAASKMPRVLTGDVFTNVDEGELPGYLRYCNYTPEDPSRPVKVKYTAARNVELGQLRLDQQQRLIFVPAPGKAECVTRPAVELSNPSEFYDPPNGPEHGENPLTNQFSYFNVPGWWDDTCCGEIDATVIFKDGTVISTRDEVKHLGDEGARNAANGGWIVTAPPKYAPYMYHIVSLLDRVYEAFPKASPNHGKATNFYRDVYPILARACNYSWVSAEAAGVDPSTRGSAHGPKQDGNLLSPTNLQAFTDTSPAGDVARKEIYNILRHAEDGRLLSTLPPPPPAKAPSPRRAGEGPAALGDRMPKLWGSGGKPLQNRQLGNNLPNQYLSLTDWQLARVRDWAEGNFEVGEPQEPVPLSELPLAEQPGAMDAAALEPTIGGGFHPGIEFPYLIAYPENFAEAFRVKEGTEPGSLAAFMSCPWQGDFWSCNTAWWPVQRPDIVFEYDPQTRSRIYKEWFRGYGPQGHPLSSSDGYNQMVYAWSKLGMVLPERNPENGDWIRDNGQMVFQEYERDPLLHSLPQAQDS